MILKAVDNATGPDYLVQIILVFSVYFYIIMDLPLLTFK